MIKGCSIAGRIETDIWSEEVSANPKGNIQETSRGLVVKFSTNKLSEIRDKKQALAVANRIAKKWNSEYSEYDEGDILFVDSSLQEEVPILVKIPKRLENKIQVEEEYQKKVQEELDRGVDEDGKGEFFQLSPKVNYQFKAVEKILANIAKVKQWEKAVTNPPMIWEKIQKDLQIPKEQLELLRNSEGKNIEEKLTSFLANYSFAVEVNIAKIKGMGSQEGNPYFDNIEGGDNTDYYSNLTVPGGTNYTENEISTPLIIPSIKGHAQFSTDKGIGWHRADNREISFEKLLELGEIKQVPC